MSTPFTVLLSLYYKENPISLRQSLDSIYNQTLLPNEVVIVKDGPLTNELEEVLNEYTSKYPNIKTIPLSQNQGLGKILITLMEKFAIDHRIDCIDGKYYPENETAVHFYKNNGYVVDREDYEQYITKYLDKKKVQENFNKLEIIDQKNEEEDCLEM